MDNTPDSEKVDMESPGYTLDRIIDTVDFLETRGKNGLALTLLEEIILMTYEGTESVEGESDDDSNEAVNAMQAALTKKYIDLKRKAEGKKQKISLNDTFFRVLIIGVTALVFLIVFSFFLKGMITDVVNNITIKTESMKGDTTPAISADQMKSIISESIVQVKKEVGGEVSSLLNDPDNVRQFFAFLSRDPEYFYRAAQDQEKKGNMDNAAKELKKALIVSPDNAKYTKLHQSITKKQLDVQLAKAQDFLGKGEMDKALDLYRTLLQSDPDNPVLLTKMATAFASKGLIDDAIKHYEMAVKAKPDDANAHNGLGSAYKTKGMHDKALEEYKLAVKYKPEDVAAHSNLAMAYAAKGMNKEAIAELKTVLKYDPEDELSRQLLEAMEKGR